MKTLLSLCCLALASLAMLFQPVVTKSQSEPAFRAIDVYKRNIGFSNFESMAITSREDFDTFLRETSQQAWNNRQEFVDAVLKAKIDFDHEALVLLRHDEASGSVRVTFETPVLKEKTLVCEIHGALLGDGGTFDMANYCFVLAVSKSLVDQVQLNAVVGFPKRRPLPQILLSLNGRQPLKFVRQTPRREPSPFGCPKVMVQCPSVTPQTGKTYVMRVHLEGGNPVDDLTYNWSVFNGEIKEGQGTRSLKLLVNDPNKSVTATVSVGGIQPDCNGVASCTFGIF